MTGFGRTTLTFQSAEIDLSLRAVNGRFLDIRMHMPREHSELESEFRKLLNEEFSRGTIDLYLHRKANRSPEISINKDLAKAWVKALRALCKELKLDDKPSLESILRDPNIFQSSSHEVLSHEEINETKKVLRKSILALRKEREREGETLKKELQGLFRTLGAAREQMAKLRAEANNEYELRLNEKAKKLQITLEPARLAQELALLVDRSDISEEISRLGTHLQVCQDLLTSTEPQGKKLDFYAQELLREVNTVGSKSLNAALTQAVVDAKSIVEKIREQVQNVE